MINLPDIPAAPVEVLFFLGLAMAAVLGALLVIIATDPFISALSLIVNFAALGALYVMLDSPFVAIAQVIVYAGAVVVLFLFVIAYLGDRREIPGASMRARWARPPAVLLSVLILGIVGSVVISADYRTPASIANPPGTQFDFGSAQAIGEVFLTRYLLEFEVTSLVLLVAAIGGIVLGLTGRARQTRMRELLHTESADRHKRRVAAGAETGGEE